MRASYSRTFETPYNENLVLSSATGVGGLASNAFGAVSVPLAAWNPQPIQRRPGAGIRPLAGRERRLLLEVHE